MPVRTWKLCQIRGFSEEKRLNLPETPRPCGTRPSSEVASSSLIALFQHWRAGPILKICNYDEGVKYPWRARHLPVHSNPCLSASLPNELNFNELLACNKSNDNDTR